MAVLTLQKEFLHAKKCAPVLGAIFRDGTTYFLMVVLARVIPIWILIARSGLYLGK
jgi:hypothetical protein